MSAPQALGISYRRASALSIALHVVALVSVSWAMLAPKHDHTRERTPSQDVRVSEFTISLRPSHVRRSVAIAKPVRISEPLIVSVPVRSPSPRTRETFAKTPIVYRMRIAKSSLAPLRASRSTKPTRIVDANVQTAPAAASENATVVQTASPAAVSEQTATPAPVILAAATPARDAADAPTGGWGQTFAKPIVADDDALESLRKSVRASDTLWAEVAVDDMGHATQVALPSSLPSDARAEIERRLLALRYVPAECNGLRCAATLRLAL